MHIFFSAGEPSGDQHAAQLIRQLRQRVAHIRCSGFGGPEMSAAGLESLYQLTDLAVMGVAGVLPLLPTFWSLYRRAGEFFKAERPDAVVLIDYPGFNWWVAKAAKRAGVPVIYYCPPQLWAWAGWRISKVRKHVDCVLSVLPFEAQWYRERGVDVEYVGHPFFDEVAAHRLDGETMNRLKAPGSFTLGILPGSRKQEVNHNFPIMLEIMEAIFRKHPQVRFPIACYKQWHRDRCAELLMQHASSLPVELYVGRTPEVIEASGCCLMVSGSVSLEMLARRTPAVVMYRAGLMTYVVGGMLRSVNSITLPNLIAGRPVMPEFPFLLRRGRHIQEMIGILEDWIAHPDRLTEAKWDLELVAEGLVQAGGTARAAEAILSRLDAGWSGTRRVA